MSDPQTFEELRRMARELPKNVLVPAHHIHSLLDETERLVERSADLQRQLATCHAVRNKLASDVVASESQLAEAKAEIEAMRPMVEACKARYEMHLPSKFEISLGALCSCETCQWYRDYLGRKQA